MIKTLLIGLWVCVVALGSSYFSARMGNGSSAATATAEEAAAVEYIKTDMISVPIIRSGKVQGYLVTQLSFAVNKAETTKLAFEPTPYLIDSAFRSIYENSSFDFSRLEPQDLASLSAKIAESANIKLGGPVVKDVLVNEVNYLGRDDVRTNWVKKKE